MNAKMFRLGAAAALLVGAARAEDALQTQMHDRQVDAVHAAMHDAMQKQMESPPASAQMPGMPDRAAEGAREHATRAQQVRDMARERAMQRGARDAAMARGGPGHGTMQGGTMHGGDGMMNGDASGDHCADMVRTGEMHGGSGGMMPDGGGKMGGGGMMDVTTTGTPTGTTSAPAGGSTAR